jgi:uncharacterized protein YcaQ
MAPISLTVQQARRLAVVGRLLSAPRPKGIYEVVEWLGGLQMDPTRAVERNELLVLWSRLGDYAIEDLRRLLYDERRLFEYWAFIVPVSDLPLHRPTMKRFHEGPLARDVYIKRWVRANAELRRHILRELRRRGPLRSRDFEDRAAENWRTGGWNEGKNVGRMLDILWDLGQITIVGRDGQERIWDLAERSLAMDSKLSPREVARQILDRQLRRRGVARVDQFGFAFDGRPPGWEAALRDLVRSGRAVPAAVESLGGEWYAHPEVLERPFRGRTTLLSPFDQLISHRDRTEELFGFHFRLEIYVPKSKRRFGYFVLPILRGERLIGRIDPLMDRKSGVLHLNAVHAELDAPASAGPAIARSIQELGGWLGAAEIAYSRRKPAMWREFLR